MTVRVLIVDDSGFLRRRLKEALEADPQIRVVGMAANGREGVEQVLALRPDVVTMDVEMPVMDGISAVREIMRRCPTPILMFSSLTREGARATLDALEAGAADFLPKRFEEIATDRDDGKAILRQRIKALARRRPLGGGAPATSRPEPVSKPAAAPKPATASRSAPAFRQPPPKAPRAPAARTPASVGRPAPPASVPDRIPSAPRGRRHGALPYDVVVIGTSTGGPVALQRILTRLPADYPLPLLLIQHMPASFTPTFAERLDQLCGLEVKEAADGDLILPHRALLAPGGRQLGIARGGPQGRVRLFDLGPEQFYKPSVDVAFSEAARFYGGRVLAVVLTGMGADGREGARELVACGGTVWAQDEATSVIYGMPGAVAQAGLAQQILPLDGIAEALLKLAA